MFNWWPSIDDTQYVAHNWCKGKTNQELVQKLKEDNLSMNSGIQIVNELLTRLVQAEEGRCGTA